MRRGSQISTMKFDRTFFHRYSLRTFNNGEYL
nr:MAG TPA: hypothetical protein [Caudoviricetes sp.]